MGEEEEEEEELEEEVEDKAGRIADVRISYREQTGSKDESHGTWTMQKVFREFCPF